MVTGSEALARRLAGIPAEVLQALRPALTKSVHEITADARAMAESVRRDERPKGNDLQNRPPQPMPIDPIPSGWLSCPVDLDRLHDAPGIHRQMARI